MTTLLIVSTILLLAGLALSIKTKQEESSVVFCKNLTNTELKKILNTTDLDKLANVDEELALNLISEAKFRGIL